jgi:DNA processing protein
MASFSLALNRPISPWLEMGAYEALWADFGTWFKSLAEKFQANPGALPSDFVTDRNQAYDFSKRALSLLEKGGVSHFGVRVHGAGDYPSRLRDAEYPIEVLYYQGWWDLIDSRGVAVVGTRKPSEDGVRRARKLARALSRDGFTVISGLAEGIDTVAHTTALEEGTPTIAVIGTPLSKFYPKQNRCMQQIIARDNLLISQVPVCRYVEQHYKLNSRFFPERNITMSALSEATIIVEAGDTSGTLTQARAALKQGRKLFILDSCFNVPGLKWPHTYLQRGAIRVKDYEEIRFHLGKLPSHPGPSAAD